MCRMLNYSAAVYAVRYAYFGEGNSTFPIWMDNVKCRGDEQTIAACQHRGWNNSDCRHYEDAGVVCYNSSIPPTEGKERIISSTATLSLEHNQPSTTISLDISIVICIGICNGCML